jgi:hypothetical protein
MKTLTIKDLARTEQMGHSAMTAVRGGTKMSMPTHPGFPSQYGPKADSSIHVDQNLLQYQDVKNLSANGSAFLDCINVNNTTEQYGQNNVVVY